LVNAQMRVRSQIQQEVERIATDFGMPTRSELDSIGQRLHDLRREVRNGSAGESSSLAREVADLRREVAALKAAMNAKASPTRESRPVKSAVAKSQPAAHTRPRPARKNKSAPKVAALRAEVKESVTTQPRETKSPSPARARAQVTAVRARARAMAHAQRTASPSRNKKSVAKVAHSPSRVGHPVMSFAQRVAQFARAARSTRSARSTTSAKSAIHARATHAGRASRRGGR
ncbi:MAG TPA: poly(R)-hydroxyalkanoic acid synthase subunit PhaE, partial [Rhodanobacteraceae bacterium]|nr:poly(R)-hydroxyalkanoic acid synthase subunit PhaE [Rhodanobacteraceae bacterium]